MLFGCCVNMLPRDELAGASCAGGVSLEGFIPDRESFRCLAGASPENLRAVFG
jgi:hypothetical protein